MKREPLAKTLLVPVKAVPPVAERAHALKNRLAVVKATAHFVRTDLSTRGPQRVERHERAAAELRAWIGDDRRGRSSHDAASVEVDAEHLLRQVCDHARDCAEAKDVNLIVHGMWPRVVVSQHGLSEALFNLLVNAIEATSRGYPILATVSGAREGGVLWEIQDTGEGMSPEVLVWVGEPFRTTRPPKSGLGVALARAIIEEHGGMLRFESAPGVGTTASAWIPVLPNRPRAPSPPGVEPVAGSPR